MIWFFVFFISCTSSVQIIKSTSETPKWIYSLGGEDYIVVSSTGRNFNEVKKKISIKLKNEIIGSIATDITNKEKYKRVFSKKNEVEVDKVQIEQIISSNSYSPGFLNGISIYNADDYYWEKEVVDGITTKITYFIRYPFSKIERRKLIEKWMKKYSRLEASIKKLCNEDKEFDSSFEIISRYNELSFYEKEVDSFLQKEIKVKKEQLRERIKTLEFNVNRLSDFVLEAKQLVLYERRADNLLKEAIKIRKERLRNLIDKLQLNLIINKPHYLSFSFLLYNKKINPDINIHLRNKCLIIENVENINEKVNVHYSYADCFFEKNDRELKIELDVPELEKIWWKVKVSMPRISYSINIKDAIYAYDIQKKLLKNIFKVRVIVENMSTVPIIIESIKIKPYGNLLSGTYIKGEQLNVQISARSTQEVVFVEKKATVMFYKMYEFAEVEVNYESVVEKSFFSKKFKRIKFIKSF